MTKINCFHSNSISSILYKFNLFGFSFHSWRHKLAWEVVNAYVERFLKVWEVKPEQSVLPSVLPWVGDCMEEFTYLRSSQEEGVIALVNLPTAGILPTMKKNFLVSLITGLLTSLAGISIAVVIHSNRATESKSTSVTQSLSPKLGMWFVKIPEALFKVNSHK